MRVGAAIFVCWLAAAATCEAQSTTTLYLLKTESLTALTKAETSPGVRNPDNTLWAGHALSAVACGGGRLFVGGQLGAGVLPLDGADADGDGDRSESSPFNVSIIKIDGILTFRTFRTVPESRTSAPTLGLGFTGMDYAPNQGATVRGLVATYDTGEGGPNLIARYNVEVAGSGVRVAPAPVLITGFRIGSCGPSWDFGPAGAGVDYLPAGMPDGAPDGPAVAVMEFDTYGPYGTDPATLNAGLGATLYEVGVNNGPRLAPDGEGLRRWCDVDIDPRNGAIAARAENTVVLATRNASGTATRVDLAPADGATERLNAAGAADVSGQHVAILHGYADAVGDLMVWNNRSSTAGGQALATVVRFNKTNRTPASESGAAVTATILTATGAPASLPSGNGQYDFAWDQSTQVLYILDAANSSVHVLTPQAPRACCLANGACFVLNTGACASAEVGGSSGAPGSSCTPTPCAQVVVASCFESGSCQALGAAACVNAPGGGGVPQGLGSTCTPNMCVGAMGACCTGTACTQTAAAGCAGSFRGPGVACDFPGNPVTCCPANFNQVGGVSVQDVFDFLTAYFAGAPAADFNGVGGVSVQDIFDFLTAYFAGCA